MSVDLIILNFDRADVVECGAIEGSLQERDRFFKVGRGEPEMINAADHCSCEAPHCMGFETKGPLNV